MLDFGPVCARCAGWLLCLPLALMPGCANREPVVRYARAQLMQEGYPHDTFVSERTIDSHIKRIRRKFEEIDPGFACVETAHGLGYRYRRAGSPR